MKKIVNLTFLLLYIIGVNAQQKIIDQVEVKNLNVARNEGNLFMSMILDVSALELKASHEVLLIPTLINDVDTLRFDSIVIAGRNRYYHRLRNLSEGENYALYRAGKADTLHYQSSVVYQKWMEQASLNLAEDLCACRATVLSNNVASLAALDFTPEVFEAEYVYQPPKTEIVKLREVRGQAYIDFPVNKTEIFPDYRKNTSELEKIRQTIDVVKNDEDVKITSVSIKGYASPEGTYRNNQRLARERTQTLVHYVQNYYHFPDSIMHSASEAEDWDGLRRLVSESNISHKVEILEIIDSNQELDAKDKSIRQKYPEEYRFILQEWYPALRHSDYCVEYVVRAYTDVEEIKRLLYTSPQKLSLQEFYQLAETLEPGSDEFNDVFETAVRMFPNDPVANLNAANAAMERNDLKNARKYLDKAGDSPKVTFARGVLEAKEGNLDEAEELFNRSQDLGVFEAKEALEKLNLLRKKRMMNGK